MKSLYKKIFISVLISTALFYYILQHVEIDKAIDSVKEAKGNFLIGALFFLASAYIFRVIRWMIWEKKLTFCDSFKLIFIGTMINNIFPGRLGDTIRANHIAKKADSHFEQMSASASVKIERILDGWILSAIGINGLFFISAENPFFTILMLIFVLFFIGHLCLILSIPFHKNVSFFLENTNKIFPGHLTKFGKDKANFLLDKLLLLNNFYCLIKALIFTLFIWGIEVLSYFLIAKAVFQDISIEISLTLMTVVYFASSVPFTLGGIGIIETASVFFLSSVGADINESFSFILILHGFQLILTTLAGSIVYFSGEYRLISLFEREEPSIDQHTDRDIIEKTHYNINKLLTDLGIEKGAKKNVEISIVIPAFNEQSRLPKTVLETVKWCNNNIPNYELIIVDDGSSDSTFYIATLFSEQVKNVKVLSCPHFGKGAAVRMGMLNAVGKYVLFMDADGATPLYEISKLMSIMEEGYHIALGSRVIQIPGETLVTSSWHRKIMGRTFAAIVNIFAISGIGDTQCGFKMFKQDVIKDIFLRQKINGFAFDVEMLYIAKNLSLSIAEVPVNWVNQKGSKVSLIMDSIKMLRDILQIRWIHRDQKWEQTKRDFVEVRSNMLQE